jgi:hypothetical protein
MSQTINQPGKRSKNRRNENFGKEECIDRVTGETRYQ